MIGRLGSGVYVHYLVALRHLLEHSEEVHHPSAGGDYEDNIVGM